jgi:hypothetical protein
LRCLGRSWNSQKIPESLLILAADAAEIGFELALFFQSVSAGLGANRNWVCLALFSGAEQSKILS